MEWNTATLGLTEKIADASGFLSEQTFVLVEALVGSINILDLGVGYGNVAKALITQGKSVKGIDISEDSLAYARKKVGEHSKFTTARLNMANLLYSEQFDGSFCASSLEGISENDLTLILSGTYTALQIGGSFVATGYMQGYVELFQKRVRSKLDDGVLTFTSQEQDLLEKMNNEESLTSKEKEISQKIKEGQDTGSVFMPPDKLTDTLQKIGFTVVRQDQFYEGTAYCISARKK